MKTYRLHNSGWLILISSLIFLLNACSVHRHLEPEEKFLKETKVINPPKAHKNNLNNLISQTPNNKALGVIPLQLWLYNGLYKEDPRRFRSWLIENLGEPPVAVDSNQMESSADAMKNYLFNKGYFYAKVNTHYIFTENTATVEFHINTEQPYTVNRVRRYTLDDRIDSLLSEYDDDSHLKSGEQYDSDLLSRERVRIESLLRERGYYTFNRSYVYFDVDSTAGDRTVNIGTGIRNRSDGSRHRRYTLHRVIVETDYQYSGEDVTKDTIEYDQLTYVSHARPMRPESLSGFIAFRPGDLFNQVRVRQTITKINALGVFQYIDVDHTVNESDRTLTAHVRLTPAPKQEVLADSEMLTRERSEEGVELFSPERFYGIGTNLIYRHRNLFRRGLRFEVNAGGLVEVQWNDWLTNYQLRGGSSLYFPGILFPGNIFDRYLETPARTSLTLNYVYENNRNFIRTTGNFYLQYKIERNQFTHFITPFQLSIVNTRAQPVFAEQLDEWLAGIEDPFIRDFYENLYGSRHFIHSFRYTILFSTTPATSTSNYWFIRYNALETAGNLVWLANNIFKEGEDHDQKDPLFGIDFYQFIKSDIDIRYYQQISGDRKIVYRTNLGAAYPYGNSAFLPFEKRYFAGGTNSIRAWRVRRLGPGSASSEEAFIDRTGDMALELNIEYRFPVTGRLYGALFADAGNVWKWEDQEIPGAKFEPATFYRDLALGTGAGLRFDFSFFIFRLDMAVRAHDPALDPDARWVIRNIGTRDYWQRSTSIQGENNYNINFGIGYPF